MTTKRATHTVFDFKDYRAYLLSKLTPQEGLRSGQRSALAAAMSCQLAYLSKVLNSAQADLSLEQAEAACRFFALNKLETSYFIALVSEARAGTESLKEYWKDQARHLAQESHQLAPRIQFEQPLSDSEMSIYYSEWYYSAIHVCVSIDKFQKPEKIASYLNLPLETVIKTLNFLKSVNLVKKVGDHYHMSTRRIHLKKNSPHVSRHHLNWKLQAMHNVGSQDAMDVHYTSVVSIAESDFQKMRSLFMEMIEKARTTVASSEEQVLACYALDFFKFKN